MRLQGMENETQIPRWTFTATTIVPANDAARRIQADLDAMVAVAA